MDGNEEQRAMEVSCASRQTFSDNAYNVVLIAMLRLLSIRTINESL